MEEHELGSDSDSSDEDYVPQGAAEPVSEEDSGAEVDEGPGSDEENNSAGRKKRGKSSTKKARKKLKTVEEPKEDEESESSEKPLSAEEEKKRADSLWADFMKDCSPPVKRPTSTSAASENTDKIADEKENKSETSAEQQPPKKVKITQIFEFAGEKVEVEKEVAKEEADKESGVEGRGGSTGRGRGISSVLAMIGKKGKLSTLEKSKLDWDKFKNQEGISEQLQSHNKGRNGYLEKQDFLQRADLRQFEIEKQMRSIKRSKR